MDDDRDVRSASEKSNQPANPDGRATPQPVGGGGEPPTSSAHSAAAAPDPFDPASLRLSGDAMPGLGIRKALLTLPVRKPDKAWWVRVHGDPDYRLETNVIELKEDRETYLVAPALWPQLATESTFSPRAFVIAVNRQGVHFLWPIKLPGADGRLDEWSRSALEAVDRATKGWVRVQANLSLGAYEVWETTASIPEPEWPTTQLKDMLRVAFRDRYIDTLNHPVLLRLRGEA